MQQKIAVVVGMYYIVVVAIKYVIIIVRGLMKVDIQKNMVII